jgi:hypothetical protein
MSNKKFDNIVDTQSDLSGHTFHTFPFLKINKYVTYLFMKLMTEIVKSK